MLPLLLLFAFHAALAQPADPLPGILSGSWTAMTPRGAVIDKLSLTFDGNGQIGPATGRVTFRGINCGAQDEPMQGTWDGTELRFQATLRPNVNAQRMGGQCGDGRATYVLRRKAGEKAFEGEGRFEGATNAVTITVSP